MATSPTEQPSNPDLEFVSEAITPSGEAFDVRAMGRGEPGLPGAFTWRGSQFAVLEVLQCWKYSSREGAWAQGELYLRRHYYSLRMSGGAMWTVYFTRQTPKSGSAKRRWFLLHIQRSKEAGAECAERRKADADALNTSDSSLRQN
ncbi:MAG: DUF6504 family protein [Phycisphaerae bacterium]